MRWLRRFILVLILLPITVIGGALLWLQTDWAHRQIAGWLASVTSGSTTAIKIGRIDGTLPFDFTLHDISIADSRGDWFRGDRIHLAWSPLALLSRQAKVDILEADTLTLSRLPASTAPSPQPESSEPFSLPHLPVAIDLEKLSIARLSLPEALAGDDMILAVQAQAAAKRHGDLALKLTAQRLDRQHGTDDIKLGTSYVAASDHLAVDFEIEEPRGGIVSKLMGLAGQRHLTIRGEGDAPLSAWTGSLSAKLDESALLDLRATVQGSRGERQFKLSLKADPTPFVPQDLRALLANGITLDTSGVVHQGTESLRVDLDALHLHGETFDIAANGKIDPSGDSLVHLRIDRLSDKVATAFLPQITWDKLGVTADITGRLALPQAKVVAEVEGLDYAGNKVGRLDLSLSGMPGATLDAPIAVTATARVAEVAPSQAKLRGLTGGPLTLDLTGSFDRQGSIDLSSLSLISDIAKMTAQAQAKNWGKTAHASLNLDAADLSRFADLAGMPLKGALKLDADATQDDNGTILNLDADGADIALGQSQADNLIGAEPRLALHVTRDASGGIDIQQAELTGRALHLVATGHSDTQGVALELTGNVPNLAAVDRQLTGDLGLKVKLTGSQDHPRLDGDFAATSLASGDIKARNISVNLQVLDLTALSGIAATARASLNGLPTSLKLAADADRKDGRQTINIRDLQLLLGRSSLSAQAQLTDGLASGQAKLTVPDLAELRPLTVVEAKGSVTATATLSGAGGRQNVDTTISASNLAYADIAAISRLQIGAKLQDATRAANIAGTIDLTDVTAAQQKLTTLHATLTGQPAKLAFDIAGKGPQLGLELAGAVAADKAGNRLNLDKTKVDFRGQQVALVHPATIMQQGQSITIDPLALANDKGQITLQGKLAPEGNRLDLDVQHMSFGLLALAMPGHHVNGEMNGALRLAGSKSAPEADLHMSFEGVSSSDLSIPPTTAKIAASWKAGRMQADGEVQLVSQPEPLRLNASLALPADPANGLPNFDPTAELAAAVTGKLDVAIVNGLFLDGVSHVGGQLDLDLKAAGPITKPNLSGRVALANGSYNNLRTGTRLQAIEATVLADGTRIELQKLDARTPGGGRISGNGQVDLSDKRAISIHITANNAQLVDSSLASAAADADLTIASLDAHNLQVTGLVKIDRAEIRIPDSVAGSVQEIPVTERNTDAKKSRASATGASPDQPRQPSVNSPATRIALDIKIDAPQQVAVRGRGLDAELGGKLHVGGDASQPSITGKLNLRHGTMDLVGRNLTFDRGVISFDGGTPIDPQLDFSAKTKAESYDITLAVGGTATKPTIAVTSTPDLPQDEALARLLFGRAAGSLSPLQALQLAQATAALAGINTGPGILDKLRTATGLDRLSIDAGQDAGSSTAATGPSLNAGRYVAPGVYLGVKQGAKAGSSAATVEIDVTSHIKVETDIGAEDNSKAGVNMQWDY
jgi:translocation and assembly module TamB